MKPDNTQTQIIRLTPDGAQPNLNPVLEVISGNVMDIGQILPVGRFPQIIGRDPLADLSLNDERASRRHVMISELKKIDGKSAIKIKDLNSTNGTTINGKPITEGWCQIGETIGVGGILVLFRLEDAAKVRNMGTHLQLISKDSLTNTYNRRAFDHFLNQEHEKFRASGRPYCLIMLDVDDFKKVNDTLGHPAGDEVLKRLTQTLFSGIRLTDMLARVGGEEFVILLTNQRSAGATILAERLRTAVSTMNLDDLRPEFRITVSVGIAECSQAIGRAEQVYQVVDSAMLEAKRAGKNRTIVAAVENPGTPFPDASPAATAASGDILAS